MRRRNVALFLALLLAGLVTGLTIQAIGQEEKKERLYSEYERLIRVVREVKNRYVREVDDEKMFTDAINGMLHGLDPFSAYIPPDKLEQFTKMTMGKFSGIGIQIGLRDGRLTVISPLEDTPAFRAGVLAGDVITEIDGESTEGIKLDEAVKKLTGPPATKVTITVIHPARAKPEKITITRAMIEIKSVKGFSRDKDGHWQHVIDPEHKIAYIRLTNFIEQRDPGTGKIIGGTVPDLQKVLTAIRKDEVKGLILDLRFNPGGLLVSATQTVDMFIEKGLILARKGRAGPDVEVKATSENTIVDLPLVVLINQFSASGSEIVAGALRDHNRAILIGERTYGKGSVQDVIYLDSGNGNKAALKLTTSKYYLPGGRNIHREKGMTEKDEWGIEPHITVEMTPEEYAKILMARRESDIIRGNNEKKETPPEKEPTEPERPKDSEKEDGAEPPRPDNGAESDDNEKTKVAAPEDRQLQRALDVLRAMDVMRSYLKSHQQ